MPPLNGNLRADTTDDHPREACGVYGILAPGLDVANFTYFGLYALQHRGQESAGIAVFQGEQVRLHKEMGLVSQVFDQDILSRLPGELAIGHTRYSTTGSSRICNAQPVVLMTRLGPMAMAHNGNLVNTTELSHAMAERGVESLSSTDSELIALLIQEAVDGGADWPEALATAAGHCRGAYSLSIGTPDGLFALRDPHGIRPLVFGRLEEMAQDGWVVSSETCGLDIVGAKFHDSVAPGELIWFRPGATAPERRRWCEATPRLCIFEMIYFARPDSNFFDKSLYSYRRQLGKVLAEESPAEADLVIGVPDSGIPAAIGFADASGIPYAEGLVKNRYVGRTFIQPSQGVREVGIRLKLNPLPDVLANQRVVVVDDSIVRGNTSRKLVKAIREAGASQVHMRISSPSVTHPCYYGIDTDTQDQLIAARLPLEQIRQHLEADSLAYLSQEGMLKATQQQDQPFCTACFDGQYPIPPEAELGASKLMLEGSKAGAAEPLVSTGD